MKVIEVCKTHGNNGVFENPKDLFVCLYLGWEKQRKANKGANEKQRCQWKESWKTETKVRWNYEKQCILIPSNFLCWFEEIRKESGFFF